MSWEEFDALGEIRAWSWKPGRDEFVPDIVVHPRTRETIRYLGTLVLCVEVTSTDRAADLESGRPSTRRTDSIAIGCWIRTGAN
jgi:hypothetical protein